MIRTPLRYHRPDGPAEASELLDAHHDDIQVLAGGTNLLPLMTRDVVHVNNILDLRGLGLGEIELTDQQIRLGAMVSYSEVLDSAQLASAAPLLVRMATGVTGGRQLLNEATLVGSLCFANPASDVPGVLVALNAVVVLRGPDGERRIPVAEFLQDAFRPDIRRGEFVTSVVLPRSRVEAGYCKVKHSSGSWPIVTASALRTPDGEELWVTLGGAQATPVVVDCSAAVIPRSVDLSMVERLARAAVTTPWNDVLAPGDYRRQISGAVAARAVAELLKGAA